MMEFSLSSHQGLIPEQTVMDQGKLLDRFFPGLTPWTVAPSPPAEHPPVASAPRSIATPLTEAALNEICCLLRR